MRFVSFNELEPTDGGRSYGSTGTPAMIAADNVGMIRKEAIAICTGMARHEMQYRAVMYAKDGNRHVTSDTYENFSQQFAAMG